jgi:HK97 family phage portal protein
MANLRSFISNLFKSGGTYSVVSDSGAWTYTGPSNAGPSVNQASSLTYSAVWSAVRAISEGVASLPLQVFRRDVNGGRNKATDHPLYKILHDRPNPEMGALQFRETLLAHVLTWGNGYAEIERDPAGNIIYLWPLRPDVCQPVRDKNGDLYYQYGNIIFLPDEILHIKGLSFDGVKGYSIISQAKESIGLGLALENYGTSFFGNGAKPSGVISVPGKLNTEAIQNMRKSWEEMHSTSRNSHRVAILQNGVSYQSIGIAPDDAQWMASRSFQLQEIARWFRIPASKIGDKSGTSYSSLEQDNLNFLQETLRPWLIRIEQEISMKLIKDPDVYAEHNQDALLRGDSASRSAFYASALAWGWLSRNEVRALENLPSSGPNGDSYMTPKNMDPSFGPGQTPAAVDQAKVLSEIPQQKSLGFAKLLEAARKQIRKIEGTHIKRISAKPNEFLPLLEKFLATHEQRIQIILDPVLEFIKPNAGGSAKAASIHCDDVKREWLDIAGNATPSTLKKLTEQRLNNWSELPATWEDITWLS